MVERGPARGAKRDGMIKGLDSARPVADPVSGDPQGVVIGDLVRPLANSILREPGGLAGVAQLRVGGGRAGATQGR